MSLHSFVLTDMSGRGGGRKSPMGARHAAAAQPFSMATKVGAATGILAGVLAVLLPGYWAYVGRLMMLQPSTAPELLTYAHRLMFTVRYWALPLSWLLVNCHLVVLSRILSPAMNPLSNNEHIIVSVKNVFTNSIEQFLLSAGAQMLLIAYVSEQQVASLIPLINLLHLFGRVLFWLFYPRLRSFGFVLTFLPTNIAIGYGLYMLFSEHVASFAQIN